MDPIDIIKIIWPVIVIQFAVQIYAIIDIIRKKKTKNLSPAIWIIIVIFGELFGAIIYLLAGRIEE
jgi:hypothetical protein